MRRQIARTRADFPQFSEMSDKRETGWWSRRDLNPRPLRCERSALPAELLPHRCLRRKYYRVMQILLRDDRLQVSPQPISEIRPFQAEADLRRDESDSVAQVVADALELVAVN